MLATQRLAIAFVVAAILTSGSQLIANEVIVDEKHKFSLLLPRGFVQETSFEELPRSVIHAFSSSGFEVGEVDQLLFIEKLDGILEEGAPSKDDAPADFAGYFFTERWQGFEVFAVAIPEEVDGVEAITFNVKIPLVPQGIQLKLFGPRSHESKLRETLKEILDGLEGQTNWTNRSLDLAKILETVGTFILCGSVLLLIIVMGKRNRSARNEGNAEDEMTTAIDVTLESAKQEPEAGLGISIEEMESGELVSKTNRRLTINSVLASIIGIQTIASYAGFLEGFRWLPNWFGVVLVAFIVTQIVRDTIALQRLNDQAG